MWKTFSQIVRYLAPLEMLWELETILVHHVGHQYNFYVIALFVRMQAKLCRSQFEKFIKSRWALQRQCRSQFEKFIKSWWALQRQIVGGPFVSFEWSWYNIIVILEKLPVLGGSFIFLRTASCGSFWNFLKITQIRLILKKHSSFKQPARVSY
jgi:hypothetical protein